VATTRLHGLLVLDKPAGITSRDAVNRAQGWFPRGTRLGHTGTLDPLATGVLVLCAGNATRLAEYVQRMPKTYRAGIVLGARSDTDDADGTITAAPAVTPPTPAQVGEWLDTFLGTIDQVPPAFSAAKMTGRRAYDLARRGQKVSLSPRQVTVHAIDVLRYDFPLLELQVRCGKGTYIRSLARDLGERLGCGGYIQGLRRTRVGDFDAAGAVPLDADTLTARRSLLPLAWAVAELPRLGLTAAEVARVRQGQALALDWLDVPADEIALFDERGELIAVGTVDRLHRCIRPGKVLTGNGPA
jgi:tRNA pseudouridine55 synthase